MATVKLIFGVFFALIAVFAGGCAMYFSAGVGPDAAVLVLGVIPAAVFGFLAYLCLRRPQTGGDDASSG